MADVLYTTTDKIRAVLGVNIIEIEDKQILDLDVETQLLIRLDEVYPDHVALKAAIDGGSPTAEESSIWRILLQYVTYEGATRLLPQIQTLIYRRLTDGDMAISRFGTENFQEFIDRISAERDHYLSLLNPEYSAFTLNILGAVTPVYDPVTNEGSQ